MSEQMPVVVGASTRRLPGDKGDQLVWGEDGSLVIHAASPIDGVVISQHRATVLIVDDKKLRVTNLYEDKEQKRWVYSCIPWEPTMYEREGAVLYYEPERLHAQRKEKLEMWMRYALLILLLPLMPLLGLLPHKQKEWLMDKGLLAPGSAASSIVFEYIVCLLLGALESAFFLAEMMLPAVICGLCALIVVIDVPHRIVLATEGRDPGMLTWPRALVRAMRGMDHLQNDLRDDEPKQLK